MLSHALILIWIMRWLYPLQSNAPVLPLPIYDGFTLLEISVGQDDDRIFPLDIIDVR